MYHAADQETEGFLMTTFPGGTVENFRYFYETEPGVYSEGNFLIYHVHAGVIG
jgi:hypothetical protein